MNPCNDHASEFYSLDERLNIYGCSNTTDSRYIPVGVYYNDVWAYQLCPTATSATMPQGNSSRGGQRYWDTACEGQGWINMHAGAIEGGCVIQLGILVSSSRDESSTLDVDLACCLRGCIHSADKIFTVTWKLARALHVHVATHALKRSKSKIN